MTHDSHRVMQTCNFHRFHQTHRNSRGPSVQLFSIGLYVLNQDGTKQTGEHMGLSNMPFHALVKTCHSVCWSCRC